jgi:hypothetical protein
MSPSSTPAARLRTLAGALTLALATGGVTGGCSSKSLTADPSACAELPVPAIACAVGPTVQTCTLDAKGRPTWVTSCPGESAGGTTGSAGAAGGSGGHGGVGDAGADDATQTVVPPEPYTVTFDLQNGGASSVYLYEGCLLELTITELADPTHVIGRGGGCGVCDCAAASCPAVSCGACFMGSLEVTAGGKASYAWGAVDQVPGTRGAMSCETTNVLPAGRYRIDVPVYESEADAASRINARTASQTFDLPPPGVVVVPLGVHPTTF